MLKPTITREAKQTAESALVPAAAAVLDGLAGRLGEHDTPQLLELQNLQEVPHNGHIRDHVMGDIAGQDLVL